MSWRHVMTSQNLIYLFLFVESVDVLESLLFTRFYGFTSDWDDKLYYFFIFIWYRDVMTSCHDVTKPDLPISAYRGARKLILFSFYGILGHWVQKCSWFFICLMFWRYDVIPWRRVLQWRHKSWLPIPTCRYDRKFNLFPCWGKFGDRVHTLWPICHMYNVLTSWRHVMTPLHEVKSSCKC